MERIDTRERYDELIRQGHQPLLDFRKYVMDFDLRQEIQRELFGVYSEGQDRALAKYYRWIWEHKIHVCEETMTPLLHYSAVHVSHILSRGAFPEMALDPRNCNLLTKEMHDKWEFGRRWDMRIYLRNKDIAAMLMYEYRR